MKKKPILIIFIIIILLGISAFTWTLPGIEIPEPSRVYDINVVQIKDLGEQDRIIVGPDEIPASFTSAIIVVEDKNFYRHHGIDLKGILRAVLVDIRERKIVEGGSTITQQTAKNLFLSHERTMTRKLKELVYAIQLERKYSKEEILNFYCNTIYFGHGAYGVEVAAQTYFGKSARDLTLAESALLAGLPQWPARYDPYKAPEEARKRQKIVLLRMQEEGIITYRERQAALAEKLQYHQARSNGEAPYFIAMVKDYLSKKYGERMVVQGGLQVYTTLDINMQKDAEAAYQEGMADKAEDLQAALVALDPRNGYIRALIGGRNFGLSTYNRVYAKRQPGSTFKPFMYSLAVDSGFTAADMVMCDEVEYNLPDGTIYRPEDYGKEPYHGKEFTIKEAIMKSDNIIAVKVNSFLGPETTANYIEKFGFKKLQPVLSLPLGSVEVAPLEMAAGYSVFANQGIYSKPIYILKVLDRNGRILEENRITQKQLITKDNAYIITNMLQGVLIPGGTGAALGSTLKVPAAAKTGTTDEFKDAWFIGFTPDICCAVWVGYDRGKNVNLAGGVAAGPIWAAFINKTTPNLSGRDFLRPENINIYNICLDSGLIASESCPRKVEMAFREGTEPESICYEHLSHWGWLLSTKLPVD
ncbi:MAG: PBP1A family penicillin-binding protein [Syntrophomonadaceae bacterium]|nr:PBP1A family penicillin-binding protein [Syntrophomonadaceae bacterium]MDD3889007.1 PBP1A family penicillin-binding protein [Syntrophomonadaceae bacterium]MDD4548294.1 PBP1A family penicillin-binding protein [Syntrophomonadaceae bacterium]